MESLLNLINLGHRSYGRWLFRRLLPGIIVITGLTITISVIMSILLVIALILAHSALLSYGLGQTVALLLTTALALGVIGLLSWAIVAYIHYLRQVPEKLLRQSPLTSHAMDTLNAFTDGLMAE